MRRNLSGIAAHAARVAAMGTALSLSACAFTTVTSPSPTEAGLSCVDDSPTCIGRRQAALRALVADDQRAWIRTPATPRAYASGVRMFAYRNSAKNLTCEELKLGQQEADRAPASLKGASDLTPAQRSRGAMLAAEVSRDLAREMRRRCKRS